jgi:hypothetical protein
MAGTTTRGFRYPQNADAPNIAVDFQNLATDIDTYFNTPQVNTSIVFEGATADAFETTLTVVEPTADRTITLPNVTGTVVTTGDTATVSATMLVQTYQTTALAATAATAAQDFSRTSVLMLGGM